MIRRSIPSHAAIAPSTSKDGVVRVSGGRPRIWLACVVSLVVGAAIGATGQSAIAGRAEPTPAAPSDYSRFAKLDILSRALVHIERYYVRPVDDRELIYGALEGMTATLDPHTSFLRPKDAQMLREDMDGRFGGVGLIVNVARASTSEAAEDARSESASNAEDATAPASTRAPTGDVTDDGTGDGTGDATEAAEAPGDGIEESGEIVLRIAEVIAGGPADKAGLRAGDEITEIEGKAVAHYGDLREAIGVMRGPAGTQVSFKFRHPGAAVEEVKVTREVIEAQAVSRDYLGDGIGVIRLREFQESSAREIRESLDALAKEAGSLRGVVLDLRDNGGGLLDQAIAVADIFLTQGVIVRTRGRKGRIMDEARALGGGKWSGLPLTVLINKGTASASEIVAGALQDHHRAVIVGERSYGKGSVQSPFRLGDGSVLKLTIALFYTPNDHMIQASGIKPDILVGGLLAPFEDTRPDLPPERAHPQHLKPEDFGHPPSTASQEDEDPRSALAESIRRAGEDAQLVAAVQQLLALDQLEGDRKRTTPNPAESDADPDGKAEGKGKGKGKAKGKSR